MTEITLGTVVYVRWVDSSGTDGWCNKADMEKTIAHMRTPMVSVGFLIDEGDDYILVSAHRSENPAEHAEVYAPLAIPKSAILGWGKYDADKSD
jgi:hypothetical protein